MGNSINMRPIALKTGGVSAQESLLFQGGDPASFREIGCLAYVFRLGSETVLVDTGIDNLAVVNKTVRGPNHWQRDEDETIQAQLAGHGINCTEVSLVVLTHMHYDHCSNLHRFPGARVILSRLEWEYLHSPAVAGAAWHEAVLPMVEYLDSRPSSEVELVEGPCRPLPELEIQYAGGHTPGSLMVEAAFDDRKYLFTGDAVFLLDNVAHQVPIGFSADSKRSDAVLARLGRYPEILLTGHDLNCMDLLEAGQP